MNTVVTQGARVLDPTRGGENIDRLVKVGSIAELSGQREILERRLTQLAEIEEQPFVEVEKARRRALVEENTRAALDKDLADTICAGARRFDQLEGEARAAARRDELTDATDAQVRREQGLASEWSLLLAGIPSIANPTELATLAADAQLTGNPRVIRAALAAITQRAGALAAVERERHVIDGPAQTVRAAIEGEFTAWKRQHPTPTERLRDAQNARAVARMQIEQSAATYRQFYGL
jgi:hypothetical protein